VRYTIAKDELVVLMEFLTESQEHLEGIEDKVLKLEVSKDADLVNSIFRPIHTIKGSSSFLGLENISQMSHEVETLLDDIRKGRITEISSEIIDVLLEAIDTVARMIGKTAQAIEHVPADTEELDTEIEEVEYERIMLKVIGVRETVGTATKKTAKKDSDYSETGQLEELIAQAGNEEIDYSNTVINYPGDMKMQYEVESSEQLASVESTLLALENAPQQFDLYNNLFRALHSLKGNTGVILSVIENEKLRSNHFLNQFKQIAHLSESIVQKKRDGKKPFNENEIDILLHAADCMKTYLHGFKDNLDPIHGGCPTREGRTCDKIFQAEADAPQERETGVCPLISHLNRIASEVVETIVPGSIKEIGGDALAEAVSSSLDQCLAAARKGLEEVSEPHKRDNALKKLKRSYKNLAGIGKKINHHYLVQKADGALKLIAYMQMEQSSEEELFITTLQTELKELSEKADRRKEAELPDRRKATLPPDTSKDVDARISDKVLKVSQEKIDVFMNLIGELLVSKNSLNAFERDVAANYQLPIIARRLKEAADTIARISNDLQTNIMEIRMLPVANAFSRFPRMVRDLSKKLGKNIKLEISGEETEIDKSIIEALADPLVHMVRNSADHGIEMPHERKAQHKPEEGVIRLSAFNQGQFVVIRISDDGKGMEPGRIRQKALERSLVPPEELEQMDEQQIFRLIFLPGFSLAKEVSDVSGRGVGMDVVRTNIEKLGGDIVVESRLGQGSTFTIKLPLTMAIGRGLEVEAAKNRYYVPLEAILETLRMSTENLFQYKGREMTVIREELIPVYRLDVQLGLNNGGSAYRTATGKEALVILDVKGRKLGLVVDNYYHESEYVIKPLTGAIADIDGISGAMITGEGKVNLILDLMRLF